MGTKDKPLEFWTERCLVLIAPTAGTFTLELSLQRGTEVLLRHRETLSTGEAMREVRPGR